jgi:hypothetical protein
VKNRKKVVSGKPHLAPKAISAVAVMAIAAFLKHQDRATILRSCLLQCLRVFVELHENPEDQKPVSSKETSFLAKKLSWIPDFFKGVSQTSRAGAFFLKHMFNAGASDQQLEEEFKALFSEAELAEMRSEKSDVKRGEYNDLEGIVESLAEGLRGYGVSALYGVGVQGFNIFRHAGQGTITAGQAMYYSGLASVPLLLPMLGRVITPIVNQARDYYDLSEENARYLGECLTAILPPLIALLPEVNANVVDIRIKYASVAGHETVISNESVVDINGNEFTVNSQPKEPLDSIALKPPAKLSTDLTANLRAREFEEKSYSGTGRVDEDKSMHIETLIVTMSEDTPRGPVDHEVTLKFSEDSRDIQVESNSYPAAQAIVQQRFGEKLDYTAPAPAAPNPGGANNTKGSDGDSSSLVSGFPEVAVILAGAAAAITVSPPLGLAIAAGGLLQGANAQECDSGAADKECRGAVNQKPANFEEIKKRYFDKHPSSNKILEILDLVEKIADGSSVINNAINNFRQTNCPEILRLIDCLDPDPDFEELPKGEVARINAIAYLGMCYLQFRDSQNGSEKSNCLTVVRNLGVFPAHYNNPAQGFLDEAFGKQRQIELVYHCFAMSKQELEEIRDINGTQMSIKDLILKEDRLRFLVFEILGEVGFDSIFANPHFMLEKVFIDILSESPDYAFSLLHKHALALSRLEITHKPLT